MSSVSSVSLSLWTEWPAVSIPSDLQLLWATPSAPSLFPHLLMPAVSFLCSSMIAAWFPPLACRVQTPTLLPEQPVSALLPSGWWTTINVRVPLYPLETVCLLDNERKLVSLGLRFDHNQALMELAILYYYYIKIWIQNKHFCLLKMC